MLRPLPPRPARRHARTLSGRPARFLVEALEGRQLMANAVTQFAIAPVAASASLSAGTPAQYTITAEDAQGDVVTDFADDVQFDTSDPNAITPYRTKLSAGTATVSVTFTTAGQQAFTVHRVGHADVAGTSPGVVVTPLAAVRLSVSTPTNPQVGTATTVLVTARDMYGNTVTGDADPVTLKTTDASAALPATLTLVGGVATASVTFATPGDHTVRVEKDAAAGVAGSSAAVDVGQIVQGLVYLDPAASGSYAPGAPALASRVVYLDVDGDGRLGAGDPTATTDDQGRFAFPGYAAGAAAVRQAATLEPAYRNAVAMTTLAADGSLTIGVVPTSAVVPMPTAIDPFAPTAATGTGAFYVQSLYRSVLGRDGAPAEVDSWADAMQGGTTLAEVAAGFVRSTEHHQDEVDAFYANFLGRTPDALGNATWVGGLNSGEIDEFGVVEAILASAEYRSAHPSAVVTAEGTVNPYVVSLYSKVLGRTPDAGGLAAWDDAMRRGMPAAEVAAGFVRSVEATDAVVAGLYSALLRTTPGSNLATWAARLRAPGGTPAAVQLGILGGPAYAGLVASMVAGADPATDPGRATTWYAANLATPAIAAMVQADVLDHGQITRADMIALLGAVAADGSVSAGELADLKKIVDDTTVVVMSPSVRSLSKKLVNGSRANALYQGQALGDLAVNSTADQVQDLVNKWFLGLDRPLLDTGKNLAYGTPAASLLGKDGQPGFRQVQQGAAGDCYFLSSLASTALHSAEQVLDEMIVANGDGTYTVRFFKVEDGRAKADYVIVDGELPERDGDYYYANGYDGFQSTVLPTWVPLVEKAYAQWNAEGYNRGLDESKWANSYAVIGLGQANDELEYLSGDLDYQFEAATGTDFHLSDDQFDAMAAAFARGTGVIFSTLSTSNDGRNPRDSKLVDDHDYALAAIDAEGRTFTLFNPWGVAGDAQDGKPGFVTFGWDDAGNNFEGFTYKPKKG